MSSTSVIVWEIGGGSIAEAIAAVPGVVVHHTDSMDEVTRLLADVPVLVTWRWSDEWLDSGLRWLQSTSTGTDQFPTDRLAEHGIALTSSRGIHEAQMSEHALGLLLAMTRGVAQSLSHQRERQWVPTPVVEVEGMTLGILGLGAIGEGLARRAVALGMRVIGTKRTTDGYDGAAEAVYPPSETLQVFEMSDVVVNILPGGPETAGIVGAAELAALRGGWFVSVGRGSTVDEQALIAALEDGVLAGAGLDVFVTEPLPEDSPLWDTPNLLITPHVAGASPRYGEKLAPIFATNLAAFHGEGEWVNRVV